MAEIHKLDIEASSSRPPPKRIMRPCDHGLARAVNALETQVGTVEAYNKLCDAATALKVKIDAGQGQQAATHWATDPEWIYPKP